METKRMSIPLRAFPPRHRRLGGLVHGPHRPRGTGSGASAERRGGQLPGARSKVLLVGIATFFAKVMTRA